MTLQRRRRMGSGYAFQRAEDGVFVAVRAASWEEAEALARAKLEESDRAEAERR